MKSNFMLRDIIVSPIDLVLSFRPSSKGNGVIELLEIKSNTYYQSAVQMIPWNIKWY